MHEELVTKEDIKALREAYNMTQQRFSYLIGIEFSSYSKWENGRVQPNNLGRRRLRELREAKIEEYNLAKEALQKKQQ